jgi:hypothetical protein
MSFQLRLDNELMLHETSAFTTIINVDKVYPEADSSFCSRSDFITWVEVFFDFMEFSAKVNSH